MSRAEGGKFRAGLTPGWKDGLAASALVLMVLLVYWRVAGNEFIVFDDDIYITENALVRDGLTWAGVKWAFRTSHTSNWHPLTWLSHMADVSIFGLNAGGHHRVNIVFHLFNTVLMFLLLRRTTGSLWRSAFVAALFGVHPLHVESVAWIAERKDLLSGMFFFLCLWGYAGYAERPGLVRYSYVGLFFALGLLSKPMVVTLPFVLLLLDYWPLGRFRGRFSCAVPIPGRHRSGTVSSLVLEKVPLLLMSVASCVVTYLVQRRGGAMGSVEIVPIASRLSNALLSYGTYLWKAVWPSDLAVIYPHPGSLGGSVPLRGVLCSAVLLAVLTIVAVRFRGRGYPLTGWLWYLGMLVPVIGVVQVGAQAMADRYAYLPMTGVFVMVSWGLGEVANRPGIRRWVVCGVCAAALLGLSVASWRQAGYWRDGVTLFDHTLRVTQRNWLAHTNMGIALQKLGRVQEATVQYREAIRIVPGYPVARIGLGMALAAQGRYQDAISEYRKAIRISPLSLPAHVNLGIALAKLGRYEEAAATYQVALRIDPESPSVHDGLGNILVRMGLVEEGIWHFREALRLRPEFVTARESLSRAIAIQDTR